MPNAVITNRWTCRLVVLALLATVVSCSTVYPRRNPRGETFPGVRGESLDGKAYSIPEDFRGQKTLLLIGYEMESQFDLDRWILGLHDAKISLPVYEVPTIPGLVPGLFAKRINDGMRSGIPSEDWAIVVTVYEDGKKIARFLGNESGRTARVVLLDQDGKVLFFHDRGFSLRSLLDLKKTTEQFSHQITAGLEVRD